MPKVKFFCIMCYCSKEAIGAILLKDVPGAKIDGGAKALLKGAFTGSPYLHVNVLRGELLIGTHIDGHVDGQHFNYMLSRDESVFLFCSEMDVAPLNGEEFLLLDAITQQWDRLHAFTSRLDWAIKLKQGMGVQVKIPVANISVPRYARGTVHYKGELDGEPGMMFGVEIMVSNNT